VWSQTLKSLSVRTDTDFDFYCTLCMECGPDLQECDFAKQVALRSHGGHFDYGKTGGGGACTDGNLVDLEVHHKGSKHDRPCRHGLVFRFANVGLIATTTPLSALIPICLSHICYETVVSVFIFNPSVAIYFEEELF
jgi:hypothetical protein